MRKFVSIGQANLELFEQRVFSLTTGLRRWTKINTRRVFLLVYEFRVALIKVLIMLGRLQMLPPIR